MSALSSFVGEVSTDDSNGARPEWLPLYTQRKSAVLEDANAIQSELDPSQTFSALAPAQKARLSKALLRFFLMKQGVAPSVPIPREDAVRVFETARREANLSSTQKLFPYFMAEVQKTLAEIFGLEIRDVMKRIPSEEAKKKKDAKPVRMLYLQSLLPTSIRSQFMEKGEKEMLGVIGVLVRLVCASEGKLKKAEAIQLLRNVRHSQSVRFAKMSESGLSLVGAA